MHGAVQRLEIPDTARPQQSLADIGERGGRLGVEIADMAGLIGDLTALGHKQTEQARAAVVAARQMSQTNAALAAAMPTGATVALLEPLDDPAPSGSVTGDAFVKLFSLNLFHGQGGRAYPLDQIAGWLRAAGFGELRDHGLPPSPNDRLIVATRI